MKKSNLGYILGALVLVAGVANLGGVADAAKAKAKAKAPAAASMEGYQRSTATSLGNMAWESVKVTDLKDAKDGARPLTWTADTPSGKWACSAQPEIKNTYCERPPAPPK